MKIPVLGHHLHAQPPIHKPSPSEFTLFAKKIETAPDILPLKLKVGQSLNPSSTSAPIRNISAAFNNLDRIGYYRNKVLQSSEIVTRTSRQHSDDFLTQFTQFQSDHHDFIQYTNFVRGAVIILQTPWMKRQLLELTREDGSKRLGTLTDTTYKFFKAGFLLTSSIYSSVLNRWIPVVLSFIAREDEDHIFEHFRFLIESLQEIIPPTQLSGALDEVVDFSQAQSNAFKRAYIYVMMKPKLIIDPSMSEGVKSMLKNQLEAEAGAHLKGCLEHFR